MTRPRSYARAPEICALLADGHTIAHVTRTLDMTANVVQARIRSMRTRLHELTGDANWLAIRERTHTQVAAEWLRRDLGSSG